MGQVGQQVSRKVVKLSGGTSSRDNGWREICSWSISVRLDMDVQIGSPAHLTKLFQSKSVA